MNGQGVGKGQWSPKMKLLDWCLQQQRLPLRRRKQISNYCDMCISTTVSSVRLLLVITVVLHLD